MHPSQGVVPLELMTGDDDEDTALLRGMSQDAEAYLSFVFLVQRGSGFVFRRRSRRHNSSYNAIASVEELQVADELHSSNAQAL
jgi:hypothetical protein